MIILSAHLIVTITGTSYIASPNGILQTNITGTYWCYKHTIWRRYSCHIYRYCGRSRPPRSYINRAGTDDTRYIYIYIYIQRVYISKRLFQFVHNQLVVSEHVVDTRYIVHFVATIKMTGWQAETTIVWCSRLAWGHQHMSSSPGSPSTWLHVLY